MFGDEVYATSGWVGTDELSHCLVSNKYAKDEAQSLT